MAGLKVVPVKALPDGSLDLVDLKAKAEKHSKELAAFMVSNNSVLLFIIAPYLYIPRSHILQRSACLKTVLRR
jgi:hypothetical protein